MRVLDPTKTFIEEYMYTYNHKRIIIKPWHFTVRLMRAPSPDVFYVTYRCRATVFSGRLLLRCLSNIYILQHMKTCYSVGISQGHLQISNHLPHKTHTKLLLLLPHRRRHDRQYPIACVNNDPFLQWIARNQRITNRKLATALMGDLWVGGRT